MHLTRSLTVLFATLFVRDVLAAPVITVRPGNAKNLIITNENTVNATAASPTDSKVLGQVQAVQNLQIAVVNNFPGGTINAYVTGLDAAGQLVMLQPDGSFYYPTAASNIATPQAITANLAIPLGATGSTTNITLPGYISSARVWLAEGELQFFTVYTGSNNGPSLVEPSAVNPSDPSANVNWGFVELTNTEENGLYANISYVDFVGLILGMTLTSTDNPMQSAEGLTSDAVSTICSQLEAQSAQDGQPWGDLCMVGSSGSPLRVISPNDYVASNPSAFSDYWTSYVDQVWTTYSSSNLTINTQGEAGEVQCTVQEGSLVCAGDSRSYDKPTAGDIFGCNSGPFTILETDNPVHKAVVPRLCAAFERTTLLLDGGNVQPGLNSSSYYTTSPTNWYSKFVHGLEMDGKGYAFSYDDVNPDTDVNQSGVVADANPELLTIVVGGPLSTW